MVGNSPTEDFRPISNNMASSMRPRALKHHNKMVSQRGKISIFWKHPVLFSSAHMYRVAIGGDAVATAVYLINRMQAKILHFKTPLQILFTHISLPSLLMLSPRIFGCVAFVHLHKNQRTKLDPCAIRCLFLGYGLHKKGFRCYDPNTH